MDERRVRLPDAGILGVITSAAELTLLLTDNANNYGAWDVVVGIQRM